MAIMEIIAREFDKDLYVILVCWQETAKDWKSDCRGISAVQVTNICGFVLRNIGNALLSALGCKSIMES